MNNLSNNEQKFSIIIFIVDFEDEKSLEEIQEIVNFIQKSKNFRENKLFKLCLLNVSEKKNVDNSLFEENNIPILNFVSNENFYGLLIDNLLKSDEEVIDDKQKFSQILKYFNNLFFL